MAELFFTQTTIAMEAGYEAASPVATLWFTADEGFIDYSEIRDAIKGGFDAFTTSFPETVAQNGHDFKVYDYSHATPRAPVYDSSFNLATNPTGAPMPPEDAVCLNFEAAQVSGIPQARRRGRIFLGPLSVNSLNGDGRLDGLTTSDAVGFGSFLLTTSNTATDWAWVVYSRTNATSYTIVRGWADNSYDHMRSRGLGATVEATFS